MPDYTRITFLFALFLATQMLPAIAGEALVLDNILDKHFEAMGGRDTSVAIENLRLRLRIWEPGFEVEGLYRASADGRMRIDIFAGDTRVFSEGIDALGGWQQNGEGSEILDISDAGLLALERGIDRNLRGLGALSAADTSLRLLEALAVEGTDYFVLEATEPDGVARQLFINAQSWMLERSRESKALHPDVDAAKVIIEERHTQFRMLCGVPRSFRTDGYELESGELIQTTQVLDGDCNLEDGELELARPMS